MKVFVCTSIHDSCWNFRHSKTHRIKSTSYHTLSITKNQHEPYSARQYWQPFFGIWLMDYLEHKAFCQDFSSVILMLKITIGKDRNILRGRLKSGKITSQSLSKFPISCVWAPHICKLLMKTQGKQYIKVSHNHINRWSTKM